MQNLLTLEDAGWKKLCPKDAPEASGIRRVCEQAGYTVVATETDLLIEPRSFPGGLYRLHATYDSTNFQADTVEFDLGRLPILPKLDLASRVTDPDEFIRTFLEEDAERSLRTLRALVALSDNPDFPRMMARQAIPAFFEKYPQGRVHVIAVTDLLHRLHGQVRVLAPYEIFAFEELKPFGAEIARMMSEAHSTLAANLGSNALAAMLYFLFPHCYGILCQRLNCEVIFQLPTPVRSVGAFPREILDLGRPGSIFGQRVPAKRLIDYAAGKQEEESAFFGRWSCPRVFDRDEVSALIVWTVERVNHLYSYLFDLSAHVIPDTGYISSLTVKKRLLTIERLLIETALIVSEREAYLRKTMFFDLHDKYSSLMCTPGDHNERLAVFNRLLKKSHYTNRLSPILKTIPEPFLTFIRDTGQQLYENIFGRVIKDVWFTSRIKKNVVIGRKEDSSLPGRGLSRLVDEQVDQETFVARYLHAARNTLHSYFLAGAGFERYLSLSNGVIPDLLPDLAWLFMFMLLEDPRGLIEADWKRIR